MIDFFSRVDTIAVSGYQFAAGTLKAMPKLIDQIDIDAFKAGITNFNVQHNADVPKLIEGMKTVHIQGSNNGPADKELAITGSLRRAF